MATTPPAVETDTAATRVMTSAAIVDVRESRRPREAQRLAVFSSSGYLFIEDGFSEA